MHTTRFPPPKLIAAFYQNTAVSFDCKLWKSHPENAFKRKPWIDIKSIHYLVVAWNCNIHIAQGRIGIAQGNGRDVYIWRFGQWLMVSSWISDYQEAGLTEGSLDLIGESARSETASNWCSSSCSSKFQNGTLQWGDNKQGWNGWISSTIYVAFSTEAWLAWLFWDKCWHIWFLFYSIYRSAKILEPTLSWYYVFSREATQFAFLDILPYLSSIPGGDNAHISRVLDGNNGTSSQKQLFPRSLQIDNVNTYIKRNSALNNRNWQLDACFQTAVVCTRSFPLVKKIQVHENGKWLQKDMGKYWFHPLVCLHLGSDDSKGCASGMRVPTLTALPWLHFRGQFCRRGCFPSHS